MSGRAGDWTCGREAHVSIPCSRARRLVEYKQEQKVSLLASSVIPSRHPLSGVKLGRRDAALLHHAGPAADQEELSPCSTGASPYHRCFCFTSPSAEIPDDLV